MDLRQLGHRIRAEARTTAYAILRGDPLTVGAAVAGGYLFGGAALLDLLAVSAGLVDAVLAAAVAGLGLAWVRALRPGLDRILTATYLLGVAGFLRALAQHRRTAELVMLALVAAVTLALTVHRIARHRAANRTESTR